MILLLHVIFDGRGRFRTSYCQSTSTANAPIVSGSPPTGPHEASVVASGPIHRGGQWDDFTHAAELATVLKGNMEVEGRYAQCSSMLRS